MYEKIVNSLRNLLKKFLPLCFILKGSLSFNVSQAARVRLAAGEWSNKFSLDAAGSGGALKAKKDGKLHEVIKAVKLEDIITLDVDDCVLHMAT